MEKAGDGPQLERLFDELRGALRGSARAAAPVPAELPAIPGYRLEAEIHQGGQGIVYQGRRAAGGERVAVKLLRARSDSAERDRQRFEREYELASLLRHPGIVRVLDRGVAGGRLWYAMELVEGEPLDDWLEQHEPSLVQRIELFLGICEAVAHAHHRGVIHRDLKPSNVLVDQTGAPRLLDFGLAEAARAQEDPAPRLTIRGEFLGTLAYAAPEQVSAEDAPADVRSDLYSLGVILYELLTGRLPYPVGGGVAQALHAILETPPADPARFHPAIDGELRTILYCALAKEPERRYPSAGELAGDLRRYLRGEPIHARSASLLYLLGKALRRRRWSFAAGAAALLVAGASLGGFWWQSARAGRHRETATEVRLIIQDILSAAAPDRMGRDATLLDVLDETARRIDEMLGDAPDVRAAVRFTIGDTYARLMRLDEAELHLRAALERYREVGAPDQPQLARCLEALGLVLASRGQEEAAVLLEECLRLRLRAHGSDHRAVAAAKRNLGYALAVQYRRPEAERGAALLGEALAWQEARLGGADPELAETRFRLSGLREEQGRDAAAEELGRQALAAFAAAAPSHDGLRLQCLWRLAGLHERKMEYQQAERLLGEAQELARRLYGDELAPEALRDFARLEYRRGDYPASERLSRQALVAELGRWSVERPEGDARVPPLLAELAEVQAAIPPPYAAAFTVLLDYRGRGSFELAAWMNGLAALELARERPARAEELLRLSLTVRCRAYGLDCPVRVAGLERLAGLLVDHRRYAEAAVLLEEALAIRERVGGADQEDRRRVSELLARCRAEQED